MSFLILLFTLCVYAPAARAEPVAIAGTFGPTGSLGEMPVNGLTGPKFFTNITSGYIAGAFEAIRCDPCALGSAINFAGSASPTTSELRGTGVADGTFYPRVLVTLNVRFSGQGILQAARNGARGHRRTSQETKVILAWYNFAVRFPSQGGGPSLFGIPSRSCHVYFRRVRYVPGKSRAGSWSRIRTQSNQWELVLIDQYINKARTVYRMTT